MRKTICTLLLIGVTLLASASDVFAQRVGAGAAAGERRRGGYGGGGYGGRGYGGYGRGYGGYGRGYGDFGFYGGSSVISADPITTATAGIITHPITTQVPRPMRGPVVQTQPTVTSQSFYFDPNSATISVHVPNPDAQVWFDDAQTNQRGMDRTFHTPGLQQTGTYTIKARWTENGRTVDQQRQVRVQPGQSTLVNIQANLLPGAAAPAAQRLGASQEEIRQASAGEVLRTCEVITPQVRCTSPAGFFFLTSSSSLSRRDFLDQA